MTHSHLLDFHLWSASAYALLTSFFQRLRHPCLVMWGEMVDFISMSSETDEVKWRIVKLISCQNDPEMVAWSPSHRYQTDRSLSHSALIRTLQLSTDRRYPQYDCFLITPPPHLIHRNRMLQCCQGLWVILAGFWSPRVDISWLTCMCHEGWLHSFHMACGSHNWGSLSDIASDRPLDHCTIRKVCELAIRQMIIKALWSLLMYVC